MLGWQQMPPHWLLVLALVWLGICCLTALVVLAHELMCRPPVMTAMYWVWPINALYLGPLALWAYLSLGQQPAREKERAGHPQPFWQSTFKAATHCGAGCTLGDLIAEWGVFIVGATLAARAFWPEIMGDYLLAYTLGIVFQFATIARMRHLGLKDGLIAAVKADTLSLTAFEVGLFAWMALSAFVFFHPALKPTDPEFWFMMQVGMLLGFATAYPMNWWLLKQGLKETM